MSAERELQVSPIVAESVVHNTKVRSFFLPLAAYLSQISPAHPRTPRGAIPSRASFTTSPIAPRTPSYLPPHHWTIIQSPHSPNAPFLSVALAPPFPAWHEWLTPPCMQTLTTLRNLTASLFGVGAGILGLESYPGFLFYVAFSLLTTALVYALRVRGAGGVKTYFRGSLELWTGGLLEGLSGFVLTWTLFYGLVRA